MSFMIDKHNETKYSILKFKTRVFLVIVEIKVPGQLIHLGVGKEMPRVKVMQHLLH